MQKKLNLEQSVCSARIFLNTFGLILEDVESINVESKLNIFDSNNNIVGSLTFDDSNVYIVVEYSDTNLLASYEIPEMSIFGGQEDNGTLFGMWYSNILFSLKNNAITASGEFYIGNFVDNEFGNKCRCQP